MARELGPGHTIVTVLCDYGNRYASKLFNPDFLRSKDLPVPTWLSKRPTFNVPFEKVD
jgi:cysteine synthase A